MRLHHLNVSTRLLVLFGLLSAAVIGMGAIGLVGLDEANDVFKSAHEDRNISAGQLTEIERLLLHNRLTLAMSLIHPAPEEMARSATEIEASITALGKAWDTYSATALTPEATLLSKKFGEDRNRLVQTGLRPVIAALQAHDAQEANRLMTDTIRPLYIPVSAGIKVLVKHQQDEARKRFDAAQARHQAIRRVSTCAIFVGLLFAGLFGLALVRSLLRALPQALDATTRVIRGGHAPANTP